MRWFALCCGIVLFLIALRRGETNEALIAFIVGGISGFILDIVGVKILHFWKYPRQPFPRRKYLAIVVPAWGVFGMTINLLWDWIDISWLAFCLLTAGLVFIYEAPNLWTKSWEYNGSPRWLIGTGWLLMIIYFRLFYMAV